MILKKPIRVVLVIAAALAVLMVGMYVIGFRPYVIDSDSMDPKYKKGSLTILDSRVRVADLKDEDIIGVLVGDSFVFHRVSEINTEAGTAFLYGDAQGRGFGRTIELNNSVLLGREVLTIPGIGGAVSGLIGHGGLVVGVGALVVILCLIPWEKLICRKKSTTASERV